MLDITTDIQSLTAFRRASSNFMKTLRKTKSASGAHRKWQGGLAVVQDAEAYQRLLDIAARADAGEGIRQGLEDAKKGKDPAGKAVLRR